MHRDALANDFTEIVRTLAKDEPLADKHNDHALSGEWNT